MRDRAHAALAALAPERVAPVGEDGAVADWILGQQDDAEAGRTAESVARMPAWHAWASEVTDRLSEVDGAELPEIPERRGRSPAAPSPPAGPARCATPRSPPPRQGPPAPRARPRGRHAEPEPESGREAAESGAASPVAAGGLSPAPRASAARW